MDQHRQHLDVWRTAVNDKKNKILRISEKVREAFYSTNQAEPAEEAVADQETTVKPDKETAPSGDRELVEKLLANQEAMALLKSLAKAL